MEIDFSGKVVLVTGASVGIGEVTAVYFAKYGAKLVLVGRNEKNLQNVASKCEKEKGLKPLIVVADLTVDGECAKVAKKTLDHYGKLDVLVNNAGMAHVNSIQDTDMKQYDYQFDLNVRAVYDLTRLFVNALIESKGNVINISSIVATRVQLNCVPYSMAKAALNHFTRLTALELAPKGVRVNTISPGATVTEFAQRMLGVSEQESKEIMKNFETTIPMGKACQSEDIAKMILFVASDHCRLVTGTRIEIDGGLNLK